MIKESSITDMYMNVLSSLTADEKLDLISKLSESLRKTKKEKKSQLILLPATKEIGKMIFHAHSPQFQSL